MLWCRVKLCWQNDVNIFYSPLTFKVTGVNSIYCLLKRDSVVIIFVRFTYGLLARTKKWVQKHTGAARLSDSIHVQYVSLGSSGLTYSIISAAKPTATSPILSAHSIPSLHNQFFLHKMLYTQFKREFHSSLKISTCVPESYVQK